MKSIIDIIKYIEDNIEYINGIDHITFGFLKKSIISRPTGLYVPPDIYLEWLQEELLLGRLKQSVEEKKMLMERQKEQAALSEEDKRKKFEELHNIKRDSKGRLNKGAKLAKKDSCNETKIYLMYVAGATVKEIVEIYGCSKSVVYRVLAKYKC